MGSGWPVWRENSPHWTSARPRNALERRPAGRRLAEARQPDHVESGGVMTSDGMPTTATTLAHESGTWLVGCPECGHAAEVVDHAVVASTAGPVAIVHVVCVQRHWFRLPVDRLATPP